MLINRSKLIYLQRILLDKFLKIEEVAGSNLSSLCLWWCRYLIICMKGYSGFDSSVLNFNDKIWPFNKRSEKRSLFTPTIIRNFSFLQFNNNLFFCFGEDFNSRPLLNKTLTGSDKASGLTRTRITGFPLNLEQLSDLL